MRGFILPIAAAFACSACGLFLDELSKGTGADASTETDSDSDTGTETPLTPCEGVDLAVDPCCNLEDSCFYSYIAECYCPTCPWDAVYCGEGDGGAPDASADFGTGA